MPLWAIRTKERGRMRWGRSTPSSTFVSFFFVMKGISYVRSRCTRMHVACVLVLPCVLCLYWFPLFGLQRPPPASDLSQHHCTHASDVCRRRVLDSSVWSSEAWVTFPRNNMTVGEKMRERPFLCEFNNVYITAAHVYFVPRKSAIQKASVDISQCCGLGSSLAKSCRASVHHDLCFCFHNAKYVASTWADNGNETGHLSLRGSTWLMHHWSVKRHPDHFSMKILELHGLMAARNARLKPHADLLPSEFDNFLSMDYHGPWSDSTSYDPFIYSILQRLTRPKRGYYFLNLEGRSLFGRLFNAKGENLTAEIYTAQPSSIPLRVAHVQHAYMSPRYKNNLPEPVDFSASALQDSFRKVLGARRHVCVEKGRREPPTTITVAILCRDEGAGLRQFVNVNEMLLSIRRAVQDSEIKIWFISSTTPAVEQAVLFCSFHILISPHSSQLTNLVFTPSGLSVIEIQNEALREFTFEQLGRKMSLHYQLLKTGNRPPINGSAPKTSDIIVDITRFEAAVANALSALRSQGFIV